ncbi:hypothetical protein Sjap_020134 [Stephania japonica]|uniref:Uncharacterized protein n=1 Tax=Stephania japonica TaxID=461633 RepID=A0AAP0F038_9MAGN
MKRKSSIDATNHEIIATYKASMTAFKSNSVRNSTRLVSSLSTTMLKDSTG